MFQLKESRIEEIDRLIFGFIWVRSRSENDRGIIGSIKKYILKIDFFERGLSITDVEC